MRSLRCEGLCKSFDGVLALAGVDLRLPDCGVTAVIGPNGAGKTTLLNALTGFVRPDAGRCYLGERETTQLPPYRIARLGIARTFQELRLILQVSVMDNVLLASPNQRGESFLGAILRCGVAAQESRIREEALRTIAVVGLQGSEFELAGELSYGQQKLLALASCLATGASILLLDEPVAGVQPEMASKILQLLRQLSQEGKTVIFIEHDIAAVRQVADHVVVMDEGRVVVQGAPREVLELPEIMEAYLG